MSDCRNEELKKWKEERINSLRTPELSSVDHEKKDDDNQVKHSPDICTPTKPNALMKATKENENLRSKLLYITRENTSLLQEMSKLKEKQMQLEDDLREVSTMEELDTSKEDAEYAKLVATAKRQHMELERLKMDVQRLRSKRGHVSKDTMLCSVK